MLLTVQVGMLLYGSGIWSLGIWSLAVARVMIPLTPALLLNAVNARVGNKVIFRAKPLSISSSDYSLHANCSWMSTYAQAHHPYRSD